LFKKKQGVFMTGIVPAAKYWVSTVSREHVLVGRNGGFCQVCHGKKGPLARMKEGDWIIHYSPKMVMGDDEVCQKFTAIGKIANDRIYQFEMSPGFVPFRRDVNYLKTENEPSIYPLLNKLSFTKEQKNWGAKFRFGFFEISKDDFDVIRSSMVVSEAHTKRKQADDLLPIEVAEALEENSKLKSGATKKTCLPKSASAISSQK
jgi:hypothetical protein